jgi:predicted nucleic acid-binding protein
MARILIDTNIWINHFKARHESVIKVLRNEEILIHPLILGELHLGIFNNRVERFKILELLTQIETLSMESNEIVFNFINKNNLYGKKIGFIDSHLLYSCLTNKIKLWTNDKNLNLLARSFDCNWAARPQSAGAELLQFSKYFYTRPRRV